MAVFAAIAAVVIPTAGTLLSDQRLTRATDQLRAELIRLRVRAMREGRVMVLRGNQGGNALEIAPMFTSSDATEAIDQTGSQSSLLSGSDQTIGTSIDNSSVTATNRTIELPLAVSLDAIVTAPISGGVELATMLQPLDVTLADVGRSTEEVVDMGTGAPLTEIYFYPNGTTSNAVIALSHPEAGSAQVWLRGLTGDATVEEP